MRIIKTAFVLCRTAVQRMYVVSTIKSCVAYIEHVINTVKWPVI